MQGNKAPARRDAVVGVAQELIEFNINFYHDHDQNHADQSPGRIC